MPITLGLEEELQVVSATTLALADHDVEAGQRDIPDFAGTSTSELHRCALEVQTPICTSVDALIGSLGHLRAIAAGRAALRGQQVLAAGLHPFSDWRSQALRDDPAAYPHYASLISEYADVARGAMSFGLHLHFGLPDPRTRIDVLNRLRERMPCVLALSASAPFAQGRDTGMHSWRHAMLDRYPRMGTPDSWASDVAYLSHIERLRKVGVLSADQGLWEDLRLHHKYGTLEVRICDATPCIERVWLIAALLLCEVHTLDHELRIGQAKPALATPLISENRWRARRHGMSADFIDWHQDEVHPGAEHYRRWLTRLTPAAAALGLLPLLTNRLESALARGTSAEQQRALVTNGGCLQSVVRALVAETAKPLAGARARVWV